MNKLMYIGGFGLAITLFFCAVLLFLIFKIPSAHRYFKNNKKTGLVKTAVVEDTEKEPKGPKRITREEYESLTEIISISKNEEDAISPRHTEGLEEKKTGDFETDNSSENATEILDKTRL